MRHVTAMWKIMPANWLGAWKDFGGEEVTTNDFDVLAKHIDGAPRIPAIPSNIVRVDISDEQFKLLRQTDRNVITGPNRRIGYPVFRSYDERVAPK